MKREFYYQDDKSNKFWTVEVIDSEVVTTNGKIGATPRETRKQYADQETALREADKLASAKLRGGYIEGAIASAPQYAKPDWASMSMSEEVFWRIIGLFNWKKTGDDEAVVKPAIQALSQMCEPDIARFENILAEKLFALDTESHAREIGEFAFRDREYFSGDLFLYARCAVVANGREFFESVLAEPSKMPKDIDFEPLLSVAPEAFERRTGQEFDQTTAVSYESFSNLTGWKNVAFDHPREE
jgi:predicted DNA-binding WGR domain protein